MFASVIKCFKSSLSVYFWSSGQSGQGGNEVSEDFTGSFPDLGSEMFMWTAMIFGEREEKRWKWAGTQ